jgi:two-component system, OmpR family, KDP operon response regulator KdpE
MAQRVLIVDDEPQILRALRVVLREAGFQSLPAETVQEALDVAALQRPDAAIVDLVLPDGDGVDVCRALREWSRMPILVLSAMGEEDDKVRALEAGADDYVTKPFGPRELVARLQAALRRATPEPDDPVFRADGLELDLAAHRVSHWGAEVHLTPTEFELLRTLAARPGVVFTREQLLAEVWGWRDGSGQRTVDSHVRGLRRKLGSDLVRTVHGVGYALQEAR